MVTGSTESPDLLASYGLQMTSERALGVYKVNNGASPHSDLYQSKTLNDVLSKTPSAASLHELSGRGETGECVKHLDIMGMGEPFSGSFNEEPVQFIHLFVDPELARGHGHFPITNLLHAGPCIAIPNRRELTTDHALESGLLEHLAVRSSFIGFARFELSLREGPIPVLRTMHKCHLNPAFTGAPDHPSGGAHLRLDSWIKNLLAGGGIRSGGSTPPHERNQATAERLEHARQESSQARRA